MAWTTDRQVAERFGGTDGSSPLIGRKPGFVFTVTVQPEAVLAVLDGDPLIRDEQSGRGESEVIVDPAMLPPVRRPR